MTSRSHPFFINSVSGLGGLGVFVFKLEFTHKEVAALVLAVEALQGTDKLGQLILHARDARRKMLRSKGQDRPNLPPSVQVEVTVETIEVSNEIATACLR